MNHTPGPWTADWDDDGQWYVNIGGCYTSGNALRGDSGECIESANARLIAAAPDLLEACLDARGWFPINGPAAKTRAKLDAAIAKAMTQSANAVGPRNVSTAEKSANIKVPSKE